MAARFRLVVILAVDETLRKLGMFDFVSLHLFSAVRRHSPAIAELLHLIERLEEIPH